MMKMNAVAIGFLALGCFLATCGISSVRSEHPEVEKHSTLEI